MLAKVLVIGKMKDRALGARADEFLERCRAYGKTEMVELPDSDVTREGKALLRELDKEKSSCIIVLSEEGKLLTTEAFASYMSAADRKIVFVIGGPFGLAPEVKGKAGTKEEARKAEPKTLTKKKVKASAAAVAMPDTSTKQERKRGRPRKHV